VHRKSPFVTMSFVDSGYIGDEAQRAAFEASRISVTVVKRKDKQIKGFTVLPKRWVVNRRTMLPARALSGPHLLNVRAAGDPLLFPGSNGERVDLSRANQSRREF